MRLLQNLSVKHKITAITLATILVVSLLSSTVFVMIEGRSARLAIVGELNTIAGILADNSTAALAFDDPVSAEETLSALKAKTNVIWAAVFRRDGSLFASYPVGRSAHALSYADVSTLQPGPEVQNPHVVSFHDHGVELTVPILLDGEVVGAIIIQSNLDQIASALRTYVTIALTVTLISLVIAFSLISRMQGIISKPIKRLLETMESVSRKQDYSVRVPTNSNDELGSLTDSFNHMLAQIQQHEESLCAARQQAETANRAKSEFLATMSHELRTPLNAILGFSELMMREMAGPHGAPQYREYSADINESGRHLLDVINDILDISKIEAGQLELTEELIEPSDLAERALRLVADRAVEAGTEVHLIADPGLPLLLGDERLVKQALLNLLSNAVKFTPDGGSIVVRLRLNGEGALQMSVRDNGIGIAEVDYERVLTPFGQVENTLSRSYPGTGLGLPLAKSFTEMHDGELQLRSTLGQGTEITLQFPSRRVHYPEARHEIRDQRARQVA